MTTCVGRGILAGMPVLIVVLVVVLILVFAAQRRIEQRLERLERLLGARSVDVD